MSFELTNYGFNMFILSRFPKEYVAICDFVYWVTKSREFFILKKIIGKEPVSIGKIDIEDSSRRLIDYIEFIKQYDNSSFEKHIERLIASVETFLHVRTPEIVYLHQVLINERNKIQYKIEYSSDHAVK